MNTFLSRLNTVFAFTLSVIAAITFLCYLSTAFDNLSAEYTAHPAKVAVKRVEEYIGDRNRNDLGTISFDLQADLRPLFNWNVKQLFVFLTALYESPHHKRNEIVLWDKIILRGENASLFYRSTTPKYYFWDHGNGLRGNDNITLQLSWNIIPNAGPLPMVNGKGSYSFAFPNSYTR